MESPHIPVLLKETVASFEGIKEGVFVDCTLGYGGHSEAILETYEQITHIGIDKDPEAIAFSQKRLARFKDRSRLIRGAFGQTFGMIKESPVVGVLADVGVSSLQLDKSERGFSFDSDRLDMRMDPEAKKSAYEVVNRYSLEELESIFFRYGEISQAYRLAVEIITRRAKKPIESAKELDEIIRGVLRPRKNKKNPSTLAFQAIRIEVNDELAQIEALLDAIAERAVSGMIVSIITFHSLEDRLVKERFKLWQKHCICPPESIRCTCGGNRALGTVLNKKPLVPTSQEIERNPRSRSAKLRTFRFF